MPIVTGVLFVLTGLACIAYAAAAADAVPADPFAAIGALLVGLGLGLAGRSLVARRIALGSLGAMLLLVVYMLVTTYAALGPSLEATEDLVLQFRLLALAILGAVVVVLGGVARRITAASAYGALDLFPLAGGAAALVAGLVWLVGGDDGLRACRNGRAEACVTVATRIIEAGERAPTAPPTAWQERAALVLDAYDCRAVEPPACALHVYAIGTVAARAGRYDRARPLFLRACDLDRNWCARAAQDGSIPWTPAERQRLTRRGGG
jgi:hypothetical protein